MVMDSSSYVTMLRLLDCYFGYNLNYFCTIDKRTKEAASG